MIENFKITHNIYDEAVSPDLFFYVRASTIEPITINWLIILFIIIYARIFFCTYRKYLG